jgi:hypothetical protein
MRPRQVVVLYILGQDAPEVALTRDQHPVQCLTTYGSDPAFSDAISLAVPDRVWPPR